MPRIYLAEIEIKDNSVSINREKAHYLTSVLRCRKGDELIILDGKGNCFRTMISVAEKRRVVTEVKEKFACNTESRIDISLVQGLLKGEKMDMVIQKTTELGVKEIIPAITERSQLRETRKVSRWRKIAEEASRQSGRGTIPTVHDPIEFPDIFRFFLSFDKIDGLLFYEQGGMKLSEAVSSFVPRPSSFLVVIGPEGGFTKEEVTIAEEKGLLVTSLGERILRAETAAISAVTLVQFLFGDMG